MNTIETQVVDFDRLSIQGAIGGPLPRLCFAQFALPVRHAVKFKAPLRVQFLLPFFLGRGEEQEALAFLSKKEGEGGVYRVSAKV